MSPACPAVSLLYCPHPPDPLPGGKGENQVYFMQGAPPLASPRLSRRQHGLNLRCRCPSGGLPSLPPPCPAFSFLYCPHPPSPLPGGKGENQVYFMQGAPPLASPGLNPRGAGSTCGGFLSGRFYKCRRRSNAGVPGAKPPAKLTFNLPLPAGKGGGGMGAVKQAKGWAGRRQRRQAPRRGTPLPPVCK